ncbi:hypothetical protein ALP24_102904 [Pseudomonas syringae pv. aptata]|uniref:Uncharacterized protein n=1 Tax=Pseudomonas syringae pv. aptata TaxID=83167 RepID=A0A3M5WAW0_PSEAP|nr:hypothetical protein ALP24_102904 [Pseudomonas syringae pv. aptata]
MVTEFSFDTDFFDSQALTTPGQSAAHDSILQLWRDHGVLVLTPEKYEPAISLIKKFPTKYQQRWREAFQDNRTLLVNQDWGDFCDYNNFNELTKLCSIFKTGVAEDEIGKILSGTDDATIFCSKTGFELLGAGAISESLNFKASRLAGSNEIKFGTLANEIWSEKIEPLAKYTKNITIIDRYCFTRIRETLNRGSINSGVLSVLKMLSSTNRKFNVKIISGAGEKGSDAYNEIVNYFDRNIVNNGPVRRGLNSLTLISNHDNFFRDYAHERFIRFDMHVCEIGLGLQVFESYPSPMTKFSLKYISDTLFAEREKLSSKEILWREFPV